jgi:hypothetical protein
MTIPMYLSEALQVNIASQSIRLSINKWHQSVLPTPFTIPQVIYCTSAKITLPVRNYEKPVRFLSGFPFKINVQAEIIGVEDLTSIVISIYLPDNSLHCYWPPVHHFRRISHHLYALDTHCLLECPAWSGK